tara:strand:- start:394 stop:1017 length:624 start_codon:yes stop_codon:yes gene_type:complete
MKISYAVTVCNEFKEIQKLIPYLLDNIRPEDEIVILYDSKNGDEKVEEYLRAKSVNPTYSWHSGEFDGHFADWKNKLTDLCNGDYIFQIDADEIPNKELIENLPQILEMNSVDVILVPRVNLVDGLTDEYIQKWKWNVDDKGRVNWPDPQWRVYKKSESIRWINKVHEKLDGFDTISNLPWVEELALFHHKDIEKQIKQNDYYDTLV